MPVCPIQARQTEAKIKLPIVLTGRKTGILNDYLPRRKFSSCETCRKNLAKRVKNGYNPLVSPEQER